MIKHALTYLLILCALMHTGRIHAQSYSEYVAYGDEAFAEADYHSASQYYGNALSLDSSDLSLAFRCAEAGRLFNNYALAAEWYRYVYEKDQKSEFPLSAFWLGMMLKSVGEYADAEKLFRVYHNRHSGTPDEYYTRKSLLEISACSNAHKLISDRLNVTIDHLLESKVNTDYAEFNGLQLGDTALVFSALRPVSVAESDGFIPGAYQSKIYIAKNSIAGWSRVKEFGLGVNSKKSHNANISFGEGHEIFFFTRGTTENNPQLRSEIFFCELVSGKWTRPRKAPSPVNLEGYTSTQPNIVLFDDYSVLYFVSDRPGGYGKNDLWYVIIKDGKYQEPVNLGSLINSPGDEITPFYHKETKTLYFSSDWHEGLGGYDVFYSRGGLGSWSRPKNIGYPLNSSCNDIYFTVNEVDNDGYFTSNRPGSLYIKSETCCNDLYYYEWGDTLKASPVAEIPRDTISIEESIKLMLPLTLYFHNDEPDPRTMAEKTKKNYKTSLSEYYAMKDIYRQEYARGLSGQEKVKAENDIEDFFENYLARGFTQLKLFSRLLLTDLERGSRVQIKIKGYCSPLTTTEYNLNLAKRRINSLVNYLREYNEGVFLPYINGTSADSGRLIILEEPLGESTASPFVSDNPNDKRNSIYSRVAAFERKIQIILYESESRDELSEGVSFIHFENQSYDLGKITQGFSKVFRFRFRNTGDGNLLLSGVETSCGCTAAEWPREPIAPGAEGELVIVYKAEDSGLHNEYITVFSNAGNGRINLSITSEVMPAH